MRKLETFITDSPDEAARIALAGELVAFPTETVYGLGAPIFDRRAVARIYKAKGRPPSNPLIAHVVDRDQINELTTHVPPAAEALADAFFPGPLTLVLPRHPAVPPEATAGLNSIGIRMPDHPAASAFIRAVGQPVVAPSANRSGRPSPTTWQAVAEDLDGRIACILRGERSRAGLESTVVDCTTDRPLVLRPGSIGIEQLRQVVGDVRFMSGTQEELARSPGTRFRHYAPAARVIAVEDPAALSGDPAAAFIGINLPPSTENYALVRRCRDADEYAHELFEFFRACDAARIETIYCELVAPEGIGRALDDRIRRAAEEG